jgi:hypothetical protein
MDQEFTLNIFLLQAIETLESHDLLTEVCTIVHKFALI